MDSLASSLERSLQGVFQYQHVEFESKNWWSLENFIVCYCSYYSWLCVPVYPYILSFKERFLKFVIYLKFFRIATDFENKRRFKPPTLQMTMSQFATPVIDVILGKYNANHKNSRPEYFGKLWNIYLVLGPLYQLVNRVQEFSGFHQKHLFSRFHTFSPGLLGLVPFFIGDKSMIILSLTYQAKTHR